MPDLWQCTLCDETVEEPGRVGHLRFTDGDGHGENQAMPDEYEDDPADYFVRAESDTEGESEASDEGNGPSEGTDPETTQEPSAGRADPESDESDAGLFETAWERLNTPIRDL